MSEFRPFEGEFFVTVPQGSTAHARFVGVRGRLVASTDDARVRVAFDGCDEEVEMSAYEVEEYAGPASATEAAAAEATEGRGIGIYFGTETGNTETIAEQLKAKLSDCNITGFGDIAELDADCLTRHDVLLLGVSTWNIGDIQYNWEEKLDAIGAQNYTGIKVGIFGLGDAAGYPDSFVDGMGILWDRMKDNGAELVGIWPTEGYEFDESKGLFDDSHFLGVVIDEDGEEEKTPERIEQWVEQLRTELQLPALVRQESA